MSMVCLCTHSLGPLLSGGAAGAEAQHSSGGGGKWEVAVRAPQIQTGRRCSRGMHLGNLRFCLLGQTLEIDFPLWSWLFVTLRFMTTRPQTLSKSPLTSTNQNIPCGKMKWSVSFKMTIYYLFSHNFWNYVSYFIISNVGHINTEALCFYVIIFKFIETSTWHYQKFLKNENFMFLC